MRKIAILALLGAGACGGDSPPLSSEEQAVVMAQLFSVAGTAMAHTDTNQAVAPEVIQVNVTEPCPGGGTVGLAGIASGFSDDQGNGSASADFMVTFTSCATVPVNGVSLVMNGAPYVSITSMATFTGGALTAGSLTMSGAFCWDDGCAQNGNGNNVCDIRVNFDLVRITGSGHICNTNVNFGR